jgi:hypothetical protein
MWSSTRVPRDVFALDSAFGLVGRLDGVHVDPAGGAWSVVHLGGGLFASSPRRLVPLEGAQFWSGYIRLGWSRHTVRTAPEPTHSPLLDERETAVLQAHYYSAAA